MKILCLKGTSGSHYVRTGWKNVFEACGHQFIFWDKSCLPAFDAFSSTRPDIFIGTTWELDRATKKCIKNNPNMQTVLVASFWGDLDLSKYPIHTASLDEQTSTYSIKPNLLINHCEQHWLEPLMGNWIKNGLKVVSVMNAGDTFQYWKGEFDENLQSDIAFVGGYWEYKSINLHKYLFPLLNTKLNIKIFGNKIWPVHQYLGEIETKKVKHIFASAKVCPNISESHSTDLGFDLVERPYKVLLAGSCCVSDYVESIKNVFDDTVPTGKTPEEFRELVEYYVNNEKERQDLIDRGRDKVLSKHTYFHRVADMLFHLGLEEESKNIIRRGEELGHIKIL